MAASRERRLLLSFLMGAVVIVPTVRALDFGERKLAAQVDRANEAFAAGQVDEALKGYTDAQLGKPDATELQYNIGAVHYRKGNFDDAKKAFDEALRTDDVKKRALAQYNLGNTLFRQGAAAGDMEKFKEAIESYKQCLKLDSDDVDAKYNIEYIQRKLKENAQRKPQQNQQNQQNKQQEQDKQQNDQQKDKQDKQDEQKKDEQQQKDQQQSQQDKQKQQARPEEEKRDKLDPKQAQQWLDRLKQDEKDQLKKHMQRQPGRQGEVSHDW